MSDEDDIKKWVEEYIKVIETGKTDFLEKHLDLEGMYQKDGEIYGKWGLSKKHSLEEYKELFHDKTLRAMRRGWDKKFSFESMEIKGDEAVIKITAETAKGQGQPLIIKKAEGKSGVDAWSLVWIPTWSF